MFSVDLADHFQALLVQLSQVQHQLQLYGESLPQVAAIEAASDGIAILNAQEEYVYLNQAHVTIFGYDRAKQLLGKSWIELYPPDLIKFVTQQVYPVLQREGKWQGELLGKKRDGSLFLHEISLTMVADGSKICVCRDITARKQAETALRQREREFRALVEHAPDIIVRLDREFRYLYVNPRAAELAGLAPTEMIGKTSQEFGMPEALALLWQTAMQQAFETGEEQTLEYEFSTATGMMSIFSRVVPELSPVGDVESVLVIGRDITELKQAEQILRHQAEQERLTSTITQRIRQSLDLDTILSTTAAEVRQFLSVDRVVIYRFYPDWNGEVVVEAVEPGCLPILGETIHDPCFANQWHLLYQEGRISAIEDLYTSPVQECHRQLLERLQVRANLVVPILQTTTLWGLLIAHHCTDARVWQQSEINLLQQLAAQVAIAIHQSELYQQLQRLNTTLEQQVHDRTAQLVQALTFEALLNRIIEKVRDSLDETQILQTVVRELVVGLNISSCDTALYDLELGTSTICCEYIADDLSSAIGSVIQMADYAHEYAQLLGGIAFQHCQVLESPNHVRVTSNRFVVFSCPIIDDQGVIGDLWLYKSTSDIFSDKEARLIQHVATQCAIAIRQARLYQATQAQVTELERLNRLKDDFLCTVSHELRTPISNVKMSVQMLEIILFPEEATSDRLPSLTASAFQKAKHYFEMLKDESQQEINLINDLLDLSRLDAETEPLLLTTIAPQSWIAHIAEPFIEQTRSRRQSFTLDIPGDMPLLTTDLTNLERILTELLNNACKYTPSGESIQVTVRTMQDTDAFAGLQLTVCNTGVEISEQERDRIFERFYRIPNHDPWKYSGTGLGLALVKKLVDRLHGTIHVESTSQTVAFVLRLPFNLLNLD